MPSKKKTHRQRALETLVAYGWEVDIVEHFEKRGPRQFRKDLFGFADLLCVKPLRTLAVQVTSPDNVASHVKHLCSLRSVRRCLQAGWAIEIWGVRNNPGPDEGIKVRAFTLSADGEVAVSDRSVLKA